MFRGIPFAAAPIGELRWKPPQPASAWEGERDVTQNALASPQNNEGWNQAQTDFWDEDCLNRNAYQIGFIFDRVEIGAGAHMQDYWAALAITGAPTD